MPTILVVEPDQELCSRAKNWLVAAGYKVIATPDGGAVMTILESENIDLVVTAIFMKDIDGLIVIRLVKTDYPELPILVVSDSKRLLQYDILSIALRLGATASQDGYHEHKFVEAVSGLLKVSAR